MIPSQVKTSQFIAVQADAQTQWEHVSASCRNRTPTWEEMDFIKRLFWEDHETVVQFHVARSEHVNLAKNCLHLWKWAGGEFPRPPIEYV